MAEVKQAKYKVGEKLLVKGDSKCWGHGFSPDTIVEVIRGFKEGIKDIVYDCVDKNTGNIWWVHENDLVNIKVAKQDSIMKLMKDAVRDTANKLCKANNTVSTLELKVELRKTHPFFHWIQNSRNGLTGVSEYMDELHQDGEFTYTDNGQYRVYSAVTKVKPAPWKLVAATVNGAIPKRSSATKTATSKGKKISKQKALDLMANNKGHFFTAEFIKQDGSERTINCQYMKGQTPSVNGHVMVREAGKMKQGVNAIRQINLQTLLRIRIAGQDYKVK